MSKVERQRVVIVGGGFAGLYAAKALANEAVDVILIDRKNHHTFQPLLYQVAAGVLSPGQIAAPIRHILHRARNIRVVLGEVVDFDLAARQVKLSDGTELAYDTLLVAAGARESYFGHDEWAKFAPGLKTLEDATDLRKRILLAFETGERAAVEGTPRKPPTFAIVGGGPTGVELAGAIADIARRVVAEDYKATDTTKATIILFEGADRILGTYAPDLSARAQSQLEQLGVEVRLKSMVKDVELGRLLVGAEWFSVDVVIWASGVAASFLGTKLGVETDRAGRVPVQPDLSLVGHAEVFVIGDMAALKDTNGVAVPGLAASACQMGTATARNVLRDVAGEARVPFTYVDKGILATIGKNRAIAQIGKVHLSGLIAWLAWGAVHIFLLIGFRNRLTVLREWIWAYITGQSTARLITGEPPG